MADPVLNDFYFIPEPAPGAGESPGFDFGSPDFTGTGITLALGDGTLQGNAEGWQEL